ncbi:MAG: hypothetical protein AMJ64_00615 [Betaproteobacteria bacterium SG8_39]|nr:MAG: hypothetical protein AMJ64_00615 [Betaproteobacteria bacterium SG8_39]
MRRERSKVRRSPEAALGTLARESDAQTLAPLRATRTQHRASAPRAAAHQESVLPSAPFF